MKDIKETETGVDKAFLKFQKRLEREPEQVVRLGRFDNANTDTTSDTKEPEQPLWVADANIPQPEDIKPCPYCSSPRTFELQIMPQLLSHIEIDHSSADALDWGTVVVYTCSAMCQPTDGRGKSLPYMEEIVIQQEFSTASVVDTNKVLEERMKQMETSSS
ncbi:programmed cell death protein 2, partial [Chytridium lagenaria]